MIEDVFMKINHLDTRELDVRVLELGAKQPSRLKYEKSIAIGQDGYTKVSEEAYEGFERTSILMVSSEVSYKEIIDTLYVGLDVLIEYSDDDGLYRYGTISDLNDTVIVGVNREIEITVDLQPFMYQEEVLLDGLTQPVVNNPGNVYTRPIIIIEGQGKVDLKVNSDIMRLDLDGEIMIDNENYDIYNPDGSRANSKRLEGGFLELVPGENNIAVTGTVTKLDIDAAWRWR